VIIALYKSTFTIPYHTIPYHTIPYHGPALLGIAGPSLQLGTETVAAIDQVRVLGVTLTSDLCLDKHVAWAGHFQCYIINIFSNTIHGRNFIKQHSGTVTV